MMKKYYAVLGLISALTILVSVNSFETSDKKGIVTYSDGQVRRRSIGVEEWENAPINTEVYGGDKVRTYRESRAELDLAQMDIVRLAPRTIIDVVRLYEETADKKAATQLKLEEGEIWASVHQIERNTEFDISSPIAAAAITGTIFRFIVDRDSTTQLKVYQGEVNITNAPEKKDSLEAKSIIPKQISGPVQVPGPVQVQGPYEISVEEWMYRLQAMQQITIDKNGQLISKGVFSSEDEDESSDWVKWNKARDKLRQNKLKKF